MLSHLLDNTYCSIETTLVNLFINYVVYFLGKYHKGTQHMGDDFFSSLSYSYGTYDSSTGFNSIGGSGYAGQNVTFQGTTVSGFDGFTSNPFLTSSTTSGFTQDQSIVGTANYQIGVDYTNNAVSGFANPNTGGAQSLTLDNTYYNIQAGSDAYLTTQFNTLGSIAEIQTLTATVIANTQGVDDTYPIIDTIDNTILTRADDGQSLNVPLSINQFNVQIKTAESTTVADSTSSGLSTTTQQQLDLAIDTELTNLALSSPNLATAAGRAIAIENANLAGNLLEADGNGFTLTTEERQVLQRVINDGLNVAITTRDTLNQAQDVIDSVRNISISDSGSLTFTEAKKALINDFYDGLTVEQKSIINNSGIGTTFNNLIGDVNNSGQTIIGISNLGLVPYTVANDTLGLDVTQRITDALIAQYITQNGSITEEQVLAIETLVLTQNAINTQDLVAGNIGVAETEININLIRKVSTDEVTDTTLPTTDQGDTAIQTVEVTANTSVTKAIRDSLGLPNQGPIVEKLISKAIDLGLNQIPGYSQINSAIGTANKIVSIGDIVTNVDLSPAETALALARLLIPQVNLVVTGYNLISGNGGGGGGGEDTLSSTGPDPVNPSVNPQVSAGGGGDDDFFGGLFGDVTEDLITDDGFVLSDPDDPTSLRVVPEDLFTETDGGLNVLTEELNTDDINYDPDAVDADAIPNYYPNGIPYDDDGNLNPGWAINPETGEPYYIGDDYVDPGTQALADAAREQATIAAATQRARNQQAIEVQRKQANEGDWRVRLRLAAGANYLYKDPGINSEGILWPLSITDGVIFPYTPKISSAYKANYSTSDLTHSNYRGYSYQNSYVDEISINAVFTAQDTTEANYLLAVIHFFRSVTKMFYGQDAQRGAPPPLVFLQGLGEFQYNLHPCVVSSFNYELPNDVDYIRARSTNQAGTSLLQRRDRQTLPTNSLWSSVVRLANATSTGLQPGALRYPPSVPSLGTNSPTYVPTKIEIQLSLLPIQSRQQISQQFSLKNFANGNLLKGGFW